MTIQKSKHSGCMIAQCDECFDIVEFNDLDGSSPDHWTEAKQRIDIDGWKTQRIDGNWRNICVDCK